MHTPCGKGKYLFNAAQAKDIAVDGRMRHVFFLHLNPLRLCCTPAKSMIRS